MLVLDRGAAQLLIIQIQRVEFLFFPKIIRISEVAEAFGRLLVHFRVPALKDDFVRLILPLISLFFSLLLLSCKLQGVEALLLVLLLLLGLLHFWLLVRDRNEEAQDLLADLFANRLAEIIQTTRR